MVCAVFCTVSCLASERVKGNGNVVTRVIQVQDFESVYLGDGVEYSHRMNGLNPFAKNKKRFPVFNYMQTLGAVALQITMDENLFPYLDVEQKEGTLRIQSKDRHVTIKPSCLIVNGSSTHLRRVQVDGCVDFVSESLLKVDTLDIQVSGVGDIMIEELSGKDLTCRVSGVGNITLSGKVESGHYSVSGVGHVKAYDCQVNDLKCEVSGVGGMKVWADRKLRAEASGVGGIKYRGGAEASISVSGIGRIKQAD